MSCEEPCVLISGSCEIFGEFRLYTIEAFLDILLHVLLLSIGHTSDGVLELKEDFEYPTRQGLVLVRSKCFINTLLHFLHDIDKVLIEAIPIINFEQVFGLDKDLFEYIRSLINGSLDNSGLVISTTVIVIIVILLGLSLSGSGLLLILGFV